MINFMNLKPRYDLSFALWLLSFDFEFWNLKFQVVLYFGVEFSPDPYDTLWLSLFIFVYDELIDRSESGLVAHFAHLVARFARFLRKSSTFQIEQFQFVWCFWSLTFAREMFFCSLLLYFAIYFDSHPFSTRSMLRHWRNRGVKANPKLMIWSFMLTVWQARNRGIKANPNLWYLHMTVIIWSMRCFCYRPNFEIISSLRLRRPTIVGITRKKQSFRRFWLNTTHDESSSNCYSWTWLFHWFSNMMNFMSLKLR